MKIALVYPALIPGVKPRYGLQPLGILYLAGKLKAAGHQVITIDGEILGLTVKETVDAVMRAEPDLVGISLMTPQYPVGLEIAEEVKRRAPRIAVCAGGAHVNATLDETLRRCPSIDFLACGEGEETLAEAAALLGRGEGLAGLPGVIASDGGEIRVNPTRPFIPDLDSLPFPDFTMLPLDRYRIPYLQGPPIASMMLSRGCPYRCAFCDAHVTQGKKLRTHSPAAVVREIWRCVRSLGIHDYAFKYSTFTLDRAWCLDLLARLRAEKLAIRYRCNTRVDRIDGELLTALQQSGCTIILFGVESGSQAILDRMQKHTTLAQIREAFRLTARAGIRTYASFMLGNPGETDATARETIALAKEINTDLVLFFYTTAYPGTQLYADTLKEGLVTEDWWVKEKPEGSGYAVSKWLSGEGGKLRIPGFDVGPWIKRAYRAYYLRPRYALKVLKSLFTDPSYLKGLFQLLPSFIDFSRGKGSVPGSESGDGEE